VLYKLTLYLLTNLRLNELLPNGQTERQDA